MAVAQSIAALLPSFPSLPTSSSRDPDLPSLTQIPFLFPPPPSNPIRPPPPADRAYSVNEDHATAGGELIRPHKLGTLPPPIWGQLLALFSLHFPSSGLLSIFFVNSAHSHLLTKMSPNVLWLLGSLLLPTLPLIDGDSPSGSSQCHSCLAQCRLMSDGRPDPAKCDCGNQQPNSSNSSSSSAGIMGDEVCLGESCFVKLELFPDESVAIVQKGCVQGLPAGSDGCNFSGQTESIHCYCQGPFCNERSKLNDYQPTGLPVLDCCECAHDEQCPEESCARSCRGNYCLVDFGANEQGCGHGVPRLQNFLRIPDYLGRLQGQMVCAHYQASTETVVNGCICTEPSGTCNQRNRTWHHQMNGVLARRLDDLNYCYSLHARSEEDPLSADAYRKAATCEGHFCFASMSTREMAVEPDPAEPDPESATNFVGVSKQRFELLGGCLKVDDDKKVSLGCTVEYAHNSTEPLSVHCICDSHLCNYFELLQRATNGTLGKKWDRPSLEIHRDSLLELQREMRSGGTAQIAAAAAGWHTLLPSLLAALFIPLLNILRL